MKRKSIIITIISAVVVIGASTAAVQAYNISNTINKYSNSIYPDVSIEDIDLSGMTKSAAVDILQKKYGDVVLKKKINIKAQNNTYTIDYSKLNARYEIEEAVNEAFSYGKDLKTFQKYKIIKDHEPKQYKLKFNYDAKPVKDFIADMQKKIDKSPINSNISMVSRGKFSVTKDVGGLKLDTQKLEKDILEKINGDITGDIEINAKIDDVQASVTADKLSKINTRISSFSTNFSGSSANRASNIVLATKSINGKVLMPGDTFSFNGVVGERTAQKGYKEAPVIVGNKLDSGLGGGICQVSTTMYNAVIRANINATERSHHTLPSHYIGLGMDATVDYGNIDYKFKNTLNFPIYIEGYAEGTKLVFNIYSDKSLTNRTYDLVSETYDIIQPSTKYIDDPSLYEGETVLDQPSSIGYKVRVYKKIYENNKLVGQELISNETYKKVDEVIRRGTKKR
ncbi:VanW family protein [Candidatus Clostridium stratigraminis]|uniref:VanW family protein n=1 Tax=Candidatus Clostridium stratigraminis TaxID=3381661 RepID=A0ABW8T758_9CLOT